ncbi:MAG: PsbP-related protein [Actinomycetota bacterium]|nr:PsbP-related protein [Actinomycetota bacterium]
MENVETLKQQNSGQWQGLPTTTMFLIVVVLLALTLFFSFIRPLNQLGVTGLPQAGSVDKQFSGDRVFLSYSSQWNALNQGELAKYNGAFMFAVERANPHAFVSVKVQTVNAQGVNLAQLAKSLDKEIVREFTDAKKKGQSIIQLDDGKALRYEYSFKSANNLRVREQLVIVPAGRKVYHLSASAADQDFDGVRPEIDNLVKSFQTE